MAGIRAALETGYNVIMRCEIINHFTLTFISPLKAKNYINHSKVYLEIRSGKSKDKNQW